MSKSSTSRNTVGFGSTGLAIGLMVLVGTGCAGTQGTVASKGAVVPDILTSKPTLATVTDIDPDSRVVTMKEADGDLTAVAVGDDIIFGRIDTGDKVRVDYQGAMGFELLAPGETVDEEDLTNKTLPEGVLFGRRVATTVEILAVADAGASTTFRCDDGKVYEMELATKAEREKMALLHPGDAVEVSCTERLSIKLQR